MNWRGGPMEKNWRREIWSDWCVDCWNCGTTMRHEKKPVVCAQLCQIFSPGHLEIDDWIWLMVVCAEHFGITQDMRIPKKSPGNHSSCPMISTRPWSMPLFPWSWSHKHGWLPWVCVPRKMPSAKSSRSVVITTWIFVLLGDLCKHLHLRPLLGRGGTNAMYAMAQFFSIFFLGGAILGLWIFVNLWSSFLFLILVWIQDNVSMIFHAWRLANSTKRTRTAFWNMNLAKHIMKCAQSR